MLTQTIRDDMREALKEHDTLRTETLRGLLAAFTNELVAKKRKPTDSLSDDDALTVMKRAVKQRKDSIEQYTSGGRPELAAKESDELAIIETYLPKMASEEDIEKIAKTKIAELGVTDKAKMGIVVGAVMKEFVGSADGTVVKSVVERLFA